MKNHTGHVWTGWFEIPASDLERASAFYKNVFQKEYENFEMGPLKMSVFEHGNVGMAVCYHPEFYIPGPTGPIVYLNANPDLQAFLDRVKEQGATVLQEKKQISPEHGYMAIFIDSEGNRMALHSNN